LGIGIGQNDIPAQRPRSIGNMIPDRSGAYYLDRVHDFYLLKAVI
jgi:hypothetical protein